jgi:PIN domain nuclease of toxin-antitoxin system
MKLLLDTHLLLWAAGDPSKLSKKAVDFIDSEDNQLFFSVASFWEIVIKQSLGRDDFKVDAQLLREGLLANDYQEILMESKHAFAIKNLPLIHKDPFDRMLVAQALSEQMTLLTADMLVAKYSGSIQLV